MAGIGPATSPLPRECSTTEPHGQFTASTCCNQPPQRHATSGLRSNTSNMERETGIEPASLAWKAKVLPLNYSRQTTDDEQLGLSRVPRTQTELAQPVASTHIRNVGGGGWIRTNVGVSQQIYSLPPLATRAPLRNEPRIMPLFLQFWPAPTVFCEKRLVTN